MRKQVVPWAEYQPATMRRPLHQSPTPLTNRASIVLIVSTIRDLLNGPGVWCLDCLIRHARARTIVVIRELDALAARVREGRCGTCAELGPVYFSPRR